MPSEERGESAVNLAPDDTGTVRTMGAQELPGKQICRYYLIHKIGEGGTGEVWLAEQKAPIRRRVALGWSKPG